MTTRRAKAPAVPVKPVDVAMKKARHLPMFGPGLVITVPLSLLPEYRELYQLQELDRGEAMEVKRQSKRSLSGILLVKRVSKTMEPK